MNNTRYPLYQIILNDLIGNNKIALFLLFLVIGSGFSTAWVTYQTRLLIAESAMLNDENGKLDDQYINLQLEENIKSKKVIIEAAAEKFELLPVNKEQEVILMSK